MRTVFGIIGQFFMAISLILMNLLMRIYNFLIKLISIKGLVLAMSFYLALKIQSEISLSAFMVMCGYIVAVRKREKSDAHIITDMVSNPAMAKSKVITWLGELKDRLFSKKDETSKNSNTSIPPADL